MNCLYNFVGGRKIFFFLLLLLINVILYIKGIWDDKFGSFCIWLYASIIVGIEGGKVNKKFEFRGRKNGDSQKDTE